MHLCSEVTGKHTSTGFACRTQVTQGCLFGHQRFGNVQLPSGRQVMKSTSSESVSDTPSEHSGKTDKQNLRQLHRQTPLFTHLNTPLHVAKYEKSIEIELSTMTDHKTVHGWKRSKGRNVASTIATPPWLSWCNQDVVIIILRLSFFFFFCHARNVALAYKTFWFRSKAPLDCELNPGCGFAIFREQPHSLENTGWRHHSWTFYLNWRNNTETRSPRLLNYTKLGWIS